MKNKYRSYQQLMSLFIFFATLCSSVTVHALEIKRVDDPWDNYYALEDESLGEVIGTDGIELSVARNEHPVAAVELFNDTNSTLFLRLLVKGPQDVLTLREGVHVRVRLGQLVADVLPEIGADGGLAIAAGESRQLWVDFDTEQLEVGQHVWQLQVVDLVGGALHEIDFELTLNSLILPEEHPLSLVVWDCSLQESRGLAQEIRADELTNGYVNAFHVIDKAPALFSAVGEMIEAPDFTELDATIIPLIGKGQLLLRCATPRLFLAGGNRLSIETELGQQAYAQWVQALLVHLDKLGLTYDDWVLYPYDEDIRDHYYYTVKVAKSVDSKIRTYANPTLKSKRAHLDRLIDEDLVDYLQLHHAYYQLGDNPAYIEQLRQKYNGTLSIYWCPVVQKRLDPVGFYRRMAWVAWNHGLSGTGYWTVYGLGGHQNQGDWGGTAWDDFRSRTANPTTLYNGRNDILIPSRRWRGFRAGLEDYLYLDLLEQQLATQSSDEGNQLLRQAQRIYVDDFSPQEINSLRKDIIAYLN
ncbi:hypothetical protein QEH59_10240 [Coraliomargarita sp. SDUM461004]|uniref:Glycoside hydrolase 123 C-terminal domain-containing protein n=1 Tax=Thalassobacterium sedimentorum TaxID=3041258 RepID=A0ABU1AJ48_9BACT|nr:hypothetical protein [Coraliomargarita sp. SDUM461004]MDQ8194806.1 hypothetical protein [Coraliomargarita sp. SDUM461004]